MWIDAHCHLTDERFHKDLPDVLDRSRAAGICAWLLGGVDRDEWLQQKLLRARFGPSILTAFGLHPWRVAALPEAEIEKNLEYLSSVAVEALAMGELGLDFGPRTNRTSRPLQEKVFSQQLEIARSLDKPIVLHVVAAHEEALQALNRLKPGTRKGWRGMVHAFQGGIETAEAYQKLGLHLSLGGAFTRSGQEGLRQIVVSLPAGAFVLESDAPDQVPYRYSPPFPKRNEPSVLPWLAEKIAELRGENTELVLERSRQNLEQILGISFDAKFFRSGNE